MLSRSVSRARWLQVLVVAFIAGGAGVLAAATVDQAGPLAKKPFVELTTLPPLLYTVFAGALIAFLLGQRNWVFGLAMFFAWLPAEDLVRKFEGNDVRIYFVKFVLLAIAFTNLFPHLRGKWRRVLGAAWLPTLVVVGFAVLWSIPAAATNPLVPVVGLFVRFGYIVLLPIGAFLASDDQRFRRALFWLSLFCAGICAIGIAQTVLGPQFLNPSVTPETLQNSVVVRTLGDAVVVRPSGPFVDAGRFASLTTVALVLGLCLHRIAQTRREKNYAVSVCAIALAAAYASGGRATLALAVVIAIHGFLLVGGGNRIRNAALVATIVAILGLSANATGYLQELTANRTSYYTQSFDPTAERSETRLRLRYYWTEAAKGIRAGGALGLGTGTQSVGLQYVPGTTPDARSESGWGNVATEGGVIGLSIWIAWVTAWLRRSRAAARESRNTLVGRAVPIIVFFNFLNLVYLFTVSGAHFDNYITNIFFWLLSGMAFQALIAATEYETAPNRTAFSFTAARKPEPSRTEQLGPRTVEP